jgi:hypothetical protein
VILTLVPSLTTVSHFVDDQSRPVKLRHMAFAHWTRTGIGAWQVAAFKFTSSSAWTSVLAPTPQHGHPLDTFSVTERMAWAAQRQTTEDEDGAYCLLGIVNILMPVPRSPSAGALGNTELATEGRVACAVNGASYFATRGSVSGPRTPEQSGVEKVSSTC